MTTRPTITMTTGNHLPYNNNNNNNFFLRRKRNREETFLFSPLLFQTTTTTTSIMKDENNDTYTTLSNNGILHSFDTSSSFVPLTYCSNTESNQVIESQQRRRRRTCTIHHDKRNTSLQQIRWSDVIMVGIVVVIFFIVTSGIVVTAFTPHPNIPVDHRSSRSSSGATTNTNPGSNSVFFHDTMSAASVATTTIIPTTTMTGSSIPSYDIQQHTHHHHEQQQEQAQAQQSKCPFARFANLLQIKNFHESTTDGSSMENESFDFLMTHPSLQKVITPPMIIHPLQPIVRSQSTMVSNTIDMNLPMGTATVLSANSVLSTPPTQTMQRRRRNVLPRWQETYMTTLENKYTEALAIHCPFIRRRLTDVLDTFDNLLRNVLVSKEHVRLLGSPISLRCIDNKTCFKNFHLSMNEILSSIQHDFRPTTNHKGYYITGKLNTTLYRDDCIFDGPDPDLPIHGLRKYVNAASQLFDPKLSQCELVSITIVPRSSTSSTGTTTGTSMEYHTHVIETQWIMNGILRLPWHPKLPTVHGTTRYYLDSTGLIYKHIETWNITALQAFIETLLPPIIRTITSSSSITIKKPN